jgi:hypothetical protein
LNLSEFFTNAILLLGLGVGAMVAGWFAARTQLQGRIERAVVQCKARLDAQYQRQFQRLRESHTDLENHAKDLTERLERRENMMRGMQVADVGALREELRQAKEEIGRLRAGGAAIMVPPATTAMRPSTFQDFVAEPQAKPQPRPQSQQPLPKAQGQDPARRQGAR